MIHAFVLIKAEREAIHSLGGKLADVEGVTEAYSITGGWDEDVGGLAVRPGCCPQVIRGCSGRRSDVGGGAPWMFSIGA
jgi:hypothetical protein